MKALEFNQCDLGSIPVSVAELVGHLSASLPGPFPLKGKGRREILRTRLVLSSSRLPKNFFSGVVAIVLFLFSFFLFICIQENLWFDFLSIIFPCTCLRNVTNPLRSK